MANQHLSRLSRLRALLLDVDGVVYRGDQVLRGAVDFFVFLRQRGIAFRLITNNSTRTAAQFAAKLSGLGIDVRPSEILTSSDATAYYLRAEARPRARVMVIGAEGLRETVAAAGFEVTPRRPDYVVVGMDVRLTYAKLRDGATAIRNGARFVASNADPTLPTEKGEQPGAGAIVAALQVASGVAPVIVGKPQPLMLQLAMRDLDARPDETAVVGDRIETDIVAGRRLGLCGILVLTGVTDRSQAAASEVPPDFVFHDVGELHAALAGAMEGEWRAADRGGRAGAAGQTANDFGGG